MDTSISNDQKSKLIAEQNDRFRSAFGHPVSRLPGRLMLTVGIASLSPEEQQGILREVQRFSSFTEDNDPHGEHDFGAFIYPGVGNIFWKIDYYDHSLEYGSEDPSDPAKTMRVLTIMLAEEY